MKLATVFVQVALVAAGILVYDQVRGGDPVSSVVEESAVLRVEPPPAAAAPMPVVLEGKGVGVLAERQVELDRRLADLEKRMRERTTVVMETPYRPAATPDSPVVESETYTDENGIERRYRDEDIAWFRALKKEADAIERHERYVAMFNRQLERMGVSLTDPQRDGVVKETVAFRNKLRDLGRATVGKTDEERKAAMSELRETYSQTVYSLVPAADAEQIVKAMGRYPGFGSRQRGSAGGRAGRR